MVFLEQGDQCAKFKRGVFGNIEIPTNARGEVLDIAVVAGRIFESRRPDERIDIEKRHQGLQKRPMSRARSMCASVVWQDPRLRKATKGSCFGLEAITKSL